MAHAALPMPLHRFHRAAPGAPSAAASPGDVWMTRKTATVAAVALLAAATSVAWRLYTIGRPLHSNAPLPGAEGPPGDTHALLSGAYEGWRGYERDGLPGGAHGWRRVYGLLQASPRALPEARSTGAPAKKAAAAAAEEEGTGSVSLSKEGTISTYRAAPPPVLRPLSMAPRADAMDARVLQHRISSLVGTTAAVRATEWADPTPSRPAAPRAASVEVAGRDALPRASTTSLSTSSSLSTTTSLSTSSSARPPHAGAETASSRGGLAVPSPGPEALPSTIVEQLQQLEDRRSRQWRRTRALEWGTDASARPPAAPSGTTTTTEGWWNDNDDAAASAASAAPSDETAAGHALRSPETAAPPLRSPPPPCPPHPFLSRRRPRWAVAGEGREALPSTSSRREAHETGDAAEDRRVDDIAVHPHEGSAQYSISLTYRDVSTGSSRRIDTQPLPPLRPFPPGGDTGDAAHPPGALDGPASGAPSAAASSVPVGPSCLASRGRERGDAGPTPPAALSSRGPYVPPRPVGASSAAPRHADLAAPLPPTEPIVGPRLRGVTGRRGEMVIGAFLGGGACGKVYECLNTETGQVLAAKQLVFDSKDPKLRQRLKQLELELMVLGLASEHQMKRIVGFYGAEKRGHSVLMYLEYCEHGSLLDFMSFRPGPPPAPPVSPGAWNTSEGCGGRPTDPGEGSSRTAALPMDVVQRITREMVEGLHFLHEQGYAHLDVKTANVLITASGESRLADLGCAMRLGPSSSSPNHRPFPVLVDHDAITELRGTALYMAPEMIRFERQNMGSPADVWSLGCVVMEMVTGAAPWRHIAKDKLRVLFRVGSAREELPMPPLVQQRAAEARRWLMTETSTDLGDLPRTEPLYSRPPEESATPGQRAAVAVDEPQASSLDGACRAPWRERPAHSGAETHEGEAAVEAEGRAMRLAVELEDFLLSCLHLWPERRSRTSRLLQHPFLRL